MKIGIITHYYKSTNYGGNLQAYALQQFLSDYYPTEQICYQNTKIKKKTKKQIIKENGFWYFIKKVLGHSLTKIGRSFNRRKNWTIQLDLNKRIEAIDLFNQTIPHSDICYTSETIQKANKKYQCFITGSDQVWHPSAVNDAYLLDFVFEKPKISYAASLAVSTIDDTYQHQLEQSLKDYKAISVREQTAKDILQPIIKKNVELVVDPVLLLEQEKWEQVATEIDVEKPYIFCYFLGNNQDARNVAEQYAKNSGLTIVTLPYLTGEYRKADSNFGDIRLYDVSPQKLLGLIKNAKCVLTDSFHITVFSYIFQKEFYVFHRSARGELSSRITDVLTLFGTQERFCDKKERVNVQYIESCLLIDYTKNNERLTCLKEQSKQYLLKNLEV